MPTHRRDASRAATRCAFARGVATALALAAAFLLGAVAASRVAAATPAGDSAALPAGIPSDPVALRALVLELDRRMFAAYDAHDVDALMAWFAPELEFYHDTGGLLDHAAVRAGFKNVFANNRDIRRELIPDTTDVQPIAGYGALQFGRHRFCHTENGRPDCGTFGFVQVWRLKDGRWQVTRELSFGH